MAQRAICSCTFGCCVTTCTSMATANPNPSVGGCCTSCDGGHSGLTSAINAAGQWGTVLVGALTGRPVVRQNGVTQIGQKPNALGLQPNQTVLVVIAFAVIAVLLLKK